MKEVSDSQMTAWTASIRELVDAENAYWRTRYQDLVAKAAIRIALGLDDDREIDLTARLAVEGHRR